jgi:tetratricopeptide (TPR) repeat protein
VAFTGRGNVYYAKQNYDSAIADYSDAIRLDPQYALAFTNRGAAYYQKQNYDRAIADLSEAVRLDPKYAFAYFNRGWFYFYRGTLDKALADCSQASELDQKDADYALWVDIIRQRNNLPSRLSQAISKIDMTKWPALRYPHVPRSDDPGRRLRCCQRSGPDQEKGPSLRCQFLQRRIGASDGCKGPCN